MTKERLCYYRDWLLGLWIEASHDNPSKQLYFELYHKVQEKLSYSGPVCLVRPRTFYRHDRNWLRFFRRQSFVRYNNKWYRRSRHIKM